VEPVKGNERQRTKVKDFIVSGKGTKKDLRISGAILVKMSSVTTNLEKARRGSNGRRGGGLT